MLVKKWMTKNVITASVNDFMTSTSMILKENKIRMLPVLKKSKLVGVITDRDLKRVSPSGATSLEFHEIMYVLSKIKVGEIMTKNPITVPQDFTVEETAEILLKNKISGTPVVDNQGELVGIVTQTDLFKALLSLTGLSKGGIQFAFQTEDRPGSIKEADDIIRNYGGRLASILSSYENVPEGYRNVYIRAYQLERDQLAKVKENICKKATMLYTIDLRDNKRLIYE